MGYAAQHYEQDDAADAVAAEAGSNTVRARESGSEPWGFPKTRLSRCSQKTRGREPKQLFQKIRSAPGDLTPGVRRPCAKLSNMPKACFWKLVG